MTIRGRWPNRLAQLATVSLGLLTGAMLLLALGLVPYWRSLEPSEFTRVYDSSLPDVGGTLMILTIVATGTAVAAAAVAWLVELPARSWLTASALGTLLMLATVPLYFAGANADLSEGQLTPAQIADELAAWNRMHWLRTAIGLVSLVCAVRAGYQTPSSSPRPLGSSSSTRLPDGPDEQ